MFQNIETMHISKCIYYFNKQIIVFLLLIIFFITFVKKLIPIVTFKFFPHEKQV